MARNRQRAKERQARRKAERGGDGAPSPRAPQPEPEAPELSASEELRSGAPPQDLGTAESVLEYEQDVDEQEGDEHFDLAEDHPEEDPLPTGPRGHRGSDDEAEHKERGRLVQFLHAVVAELRRVQWPDRQALWQATAVVVVACIVVGVYLYALDNAFNRAAEWLIGQQAG